MLNTSWLPMRYLSAFHSQRPRLGIAEHDDDDGDGGDDDETLVQSEPGERHEHST